MVILLFALALAPCLFLLWYFYNKDKYEPEPKRLIVRMFLLGALFVIPAGFIESLILYPLEKQSGGLLLAFFESFIIVAPIEELTKFLVVRRWVYRNHEFNEVMDGIVYAVAASLGFAALENVFYVVSKGFTVGIIRAVLSVPGHAFFGALMGYWIGKAKFNKTREKTYMETGILLAIFCHGLFNFLLLTRSILSLLVFVLILIMGLTARKNLKSAQLDSRARLLEKRSQSLNRDRIEGPGPHS